MADPKSRIERLTKLLSWELAGCWSCTGDPWPHLIVERQINAEMGNVPYLPKGDWRTSYLVQGWSWWPASPTCTVTSKVRVMSCQSDMFAHNLTTKSRRNTEIGRKVVCAMADIPHQFQSQKVKGQGHQAT